MYSAKDIAIWFLLKNNAEVKEHIVTNDDEYEVYEGITHLKLQKLLYYAQGLNLAINGEKLFSENIEAWKHGPVISEIYNAYCIYGRNPIEIQMGPEEERILNNIESDEKASNILNLTYNNFAIYTAWQLREMTHQDNTPWDITQKEKGLNRVIDTDLMKKYFKEEIIE